MGTDLALFHGGGYVPILEPRSFSGRVEEMLVRHDVSGRLHPQLPRLLVVGNSAPGSGIGEGQLQLQLMQGGSDVQVFNASQGGASARAWFLLLKNTPLLDGSTKLLVYGVLLPQLQLPAGSNRDLALIKTRLKVRDGWWLAQRFGEDRDEAMSMLAASVFRTPLYRRDLRALLDDPAGRWKRLQTERAFRLRYWQGFRRDHMGRGPSPGPRRAISIPREEEDTDRFLRPYDAPLHPSQPPLLADVVKLLAARDIEVLLAVLPSGPRHPPCFDPALVSQLDSALRRQGVNPSIFFPRELLPRLESPGYFRDSLHLNGTGREIYTTALAQHILTRSRPSPEPSRPQRTD